MTKPSLFRLLPLVAAIALVLVWLASRRDASAPAVVTGATLPVLEQPVARAAALPASTIAPAGQLPGYSAPPIESASPTELRALVSAEAARSGATQPAGSYLGADGKPQAFAYNSGRSSPEAARRDERRLQLMAELLADKPGFARRHGLAAKQVDWIVDGQADFPDELLD